MTVVYDKQANLADPREINLCFYTNPTSMAIVGYRTTLDPAVVSEKLNPGVPPAQIQIAEIDGNIVGAWAEDYGTGTDDAKVWHKIDAPASAPGPIIVYDRTPLGEEEDPEDDEHKRYVTDITGEKGHVMHLLFAGASTPDGFELSSGAGQEFNNVFPMGPAAEIDANTDTPVYDLTFVSCTDSGNKALVGGSGYLGVHKHNGIHATIQQGASESCVPPYHMLKMIRSTYIKPAIPKDAIIIFDGDLPAGFTRYSSADGKYIRTGATVAETGGAATRRIFCEGYTAGPTSSGWNAYSSYYLKNIVTSTHYHYFGGYSAAINNSPPYINVILAKADNDLAFIPAGAIIMFDTVPPSEDWDVVNFNGKLLRGNAAYGGTGGNATTTPANVTITTGGESGCTTAYCESSSYATACGHAHSFVVNVGTIQTYPKCRPVVFAKAKHNITAEGESACIIANDLSQTTYPYMTGALTSATGRHLAIRNNGSSEGELHCAFVAASGGADHAYHGKSTNGGQTWSVGRIDSSWDGNQLEVCMVIDAENRIHFTWTEYGESGRRGIKYRRLNANDSWESVEAVSTAGNDYYQADSCIQVMKDGTSIGVTWTGQGWGSSPSRYNIAYRERTTSWGSEVQITTDSTSPYNYCCPSLDFDKDDYPHIITTYTDWTTANLYYAHKTEAGWQALQHVNSDDSGNAGLNSNILIDPDNYVHIAYISKPPHNVIYKKKLIGGAWPAKETVAESAANTEYTTPQLQIAGSSQVICCYTKVVTTDKGRHKAVYKVRNGSWGSETIIRSSDAMSFLYVQMAWSRLPLKGGIWQPVPQQGLVFVYATTPSTDQSSGKLEFHPLIKTVIGDIPGDIVVEPFKAKRRGAICLSKINGPLASPALIS